MTEPNERHRRVSHVHSERTAAINVQGEPGPPAVYDLETQLDVRLTSDQLRAEFHDFYARSRDRVGRALALTLHDADLAADSVDEAMVRAYQRWHKVRSLENPAAWTYRVGLNHARSRLRRVARKLAFGTVARPEATIGEPFTEPAIAAALAGLSVDHRSVVVCRLLLDWSEAETAVALRLRPGTVKSRLSRALAQLEPRLAHLRTEDHR